MEGYTTEIDTVLYRLLDNEHLGSAKVDWLRLILKENDNGQQTLRRQILRHGNWTEHLNVACHKSKPRHLSDIVPLLLEAGADPNGKQEISEVPYDIEPPISLVRWNGSKNANKHEVNGETLRRVMNSDLIHHPLGQVLLNLISSRRYGFPRGVAKTVKAFVDGGVTSSSRLHFWPTTKSSPWQLSMVGNYLWFTIMTYLQTTHPSFKCKKLNRRVVPAFTFFESTEFLATIRILCQTETKDDLCGIAKRPSTSYYLDSPMTEDESILVKEHSFETALMAACRGGMPKAAAIILNAGANIDATDIYGRTALMMCASKEMMEFMVSRGASLITRWEMGTIVHAVLFHCGQYLAAGFRSMCFQHRWVRHVPEITTEAVDKLLDFIFNQAAGKSYSLATSTNVHGSSPLHFAMSITNVPLTAISILLREGADPNSEFACNDGGVGDASQLASDPFYTSVRHSAGLRPLQKAVIHRRLDIYQLLLQHVNLHTHMNDMKPSLADWLENESLYSVSGNDEEWFENAREALEATLKEQGILWDKKL